MQQPFALLRFTCYPGTTSKDPPHAKTQLPRQAISNCKSNPSARDSLHAKTRLSRASTHLLQLYSTQSLPAKALHTQGRAFPGKHSGIATLYCIRQLPAKTLHTRRRACPDQANFASLIDPETFGQYLGLLSTLKHTRISRPVHKSLSPAGHPTPYQHSFVVGPIA